MDTLIINNLEMANIKSIGVALDERTKLLLDNYSKLHSVSKSAVIQIAINDFLLVMGDRNVTDK